MRHLVTVINGVILAVIGLIIGPIIPDGLVSLLYYVGIVVISMALIIGGGYAFVRARSRSS